MIRTFPQSDPVVRRDAPNGLLTAEHLDMELGPGAYRVFVDRMEVTCSVHCVDEREGWAVIADARRDDICWKLVTGRVELRVK
jgi:hypothetical protein